MSPLPSPIRIGTSGYTYSWNKKHPTPFKWYLSQGFNSVEINASYYRFPLDSWINTWKASISNDFAFSIKVNNVDNIDFWLFKMPRSYRYTEENLQTVRTFFDKARLDNNSDNIRAVIEFRDPSWWTAIDRIEEIGIVFCSVDAPDLPRTISVTNNSIYLRIHGYKEWYRYVYSEAELDVILSSVKNLNAGKKAIYLNNDHGMLQNGLYLLKQTL